ncbi:alpha/beta fold hydrolase [uncultured Pigmentiphaga sp.]|uniref:alpha/beta fold hydrolase n=1 Tax=uncultured Pigmentiphaga sp. TaxID=340361 RepID=UPI00262D459F|nr:alpha/beta fold hydrolase [uncultured Pigmentiphaga sp.]
MTRQGALDPASGLYFTEHGSASHPAIVLTHSILADGRMWDRQVAWLAKEYRVINVDLPGHGQCPLVPGGVSLASLADGIVKLAAARGLESFHYVGVSLGAMIGYELATRCSTWLASMVACDAPPFAPDNYPALWEARISRAQRDGTAALVEETLQRWFTPQTLARRPDYVEELSETIAQTSAEGFEHCALAISRFDYRDALRACTVRTTLVAGESDGTIPEALQALAAQMPNAVWCEIPGAGHLPNLENPDAFDAMLRRHLSS